MIEGPAVISLPESPEAERRNDRNIIYVVPSGFAPSGPPLLPEDAESLLKELEQLIEIEQRELQSSPAGESLSGL